MDVLLSDVEGWFKKHAGGCLDNAEGAGEEGRVDWPNAFVSTGREMGARVERKCGVLATVQNCHIWSMYTYLT